MLPSPSPLACSVISFAFSNLTWPPLSLPPIACLRVCSFTLIPCLLPLRRHTLSPPGASSLRVPALLASFVSSRCVRRSLGRPPDSRRGGGGGGCRSAACGDSSLSTLPSSTSASTPSSRSTTRPLSQPASFSLFRAPAFSSTRTFSTRSASAASFLSSLLFRHRIVLLLLRPPYTVHQHMSFKHFQQIATGSANGKTSRPNE